MADSSYTNRIVGHGAESPKDLSKMTHPLNWRVHPETQKAVLNDVLRDVGWVQQVVVNKTTNHLIDGHLRVALALEQKAKEVPVVYVELSEEEEKLILLSLDPITALAESSSDQLEKLLKDFSTNSSYIRETLDQVYFSSVDPFMVARLKISDLKKHPNNYKEHPDDQIDHIIHSIKKNGYYRNVIVSRDYTILAGHGVVEASKKMGKKYVPAIILDIDSLDTRALKVLVSDNEISHYAIVDDRKLTEMLKSILGNDADGLIGSGFNEEQLSALLMVTRPESEIRDKNEAAEWMGMPDYDTGEEYFKIIMNFNNESDRERFVEENGIIIDYKSSKTWSTRWPYTEREDIASLRFNE